MTLSSRIRRFTLVATTCVLATASSMSWAAVDPEVQKHFDIGNSLYQEGRYGDALREYDAAYTLSKNWKILYNRGQCLVMLKRDPEAVVVFQQYLDEGGSQIAPDRKKQIEEDLPKLRARSATIRVENAPPGSIVFLGDWRVGPVFKSASAAGPTELTIPIGAGEYDLRVEPPPGLNAPPFKQHLAITGGMQAAVRVEFATPPTADAAPPPIAPPPAQVDQPPVLPPRPPGGLAAPSFQVSAQASAVFPSVDTKSVGSFALGAFEIVASYRATSFFELGLFGDFASGKPTVDSGIVARESVDANAKYSYRILGARGRLHLLRTKRIDGWFGLDFGAFQESWSFTGQNSFDFKASSAAFGLGLGFDIPLGRSWAIGAAARFIAASANNGARESCSPTTPCDGALPGESASNRATSRSFLDVGARLVWVLPFGDPDPTPSPAPQPKSTVTAAARRNIP